jgi:CheY-like chemotaxis protein
MDDSQTIVVVDDTAEIVDLLTIFLSEEGFRVVSCQDAGEALDLILAERPALVILDLKMAGLQTWELVDTLAADPRTARLPFIICSGAIAELRAAEARVQALGGDVLGKPFDLELLLSKVEHLIGQASQANQG